MIHFEFLAFQPGLDLKVDSMTDGLLRLHAKDRHAPRQAFSLLTHCVLDNGFCASDLPHVAARYRGLPARPSQTAPSHGLALQEVKDALIKAKSHGGAISVDHILEQVYGNIGRIKSQLETDSEPEPDDHFRFNKDKKFVIRRLPPWDEDIARIFMQTKVTPPEYEKNINAITEDGDEVEVDANAGVVRILKRG